MRKDVRRGNDRGLAVLFFYFFGCFDVEKGLYRFNAVRVRVLGDIGRLDAQRPYALLLKTAKECAVIGADINDQIFPIQIIFFDEGVADKPLIVGQSEEHTSELQSQSNL